MLEDRGFGAANYPYSPYGYSSYGYSPSGYPSFLYHGAPYNSAGNGGSVGNSNVVDNTNAYGFGGSFFSRIEGTDIKKTTGTIDGAKGVFSTSYASLDKDGKGKFEMAAGKIPN